MSTFQKVGARANPSAPGYPGCDSLKRQFGPVWPNQCHVACSLDPKSHLTFSRRLDDLLQLDPLSICPGVHSYPCGVPVLELVLIVNDPTRDSVDLKVNGCSDPVVSVQDDSWGRGRNDRDRNLARQRECTQMVNQVL